MVVATGVVLNVKVDPPSNDNNGDVAAVDEKVKSDESPVLAP